MTKTLIKNTFREIRNSKARFISIMAIIALGVGFFAGIKATVPSMYNLAETYYDEQNLMDFRLVSTVGFDEDDIKAISEVEGVTAVMPSYYCDVLKSAQSGGKAVRVIALPTAYEVNETLNDLVLKDGRLPQSLGEVVVESSAFSSSDYKIGDKVEFAAVSGETDVTTQLNSLEYTVVGIVESPLYISYQRGATSVGDGKISEYMYILPDDFAFERYTELYVKTEVSEKYSPFSDEYESEIDSFKSTLEDAADVRCEVFDADVIGKAEDELSQAKADYDTEYQEADKEFASALQELDDGKKELAESIDSAQKTLDEAKEKLESGKLDLQTATDEYYSQIAAAEEEIDEQEKKLNSSNEQYLASKSEYDEKIAAAQAELDSGFEQYNAALSEFKTTQEPQLLAGIEQAQAAVDALNVAIGSTVDEVPLAVLNQQLAEAQATLDSLNSQYEQAKAQLEQTEEKLSASQAELDAQAKSGEDELDLAKQQLDEGFAAIAAARAELETQKTEGYNQLVSAQNTLDNSQAQYESGVQELESQRKSGQQKLDDAQAEYDSKKSEADEKFADARKEIQTAQQELDDIDEPVWYVFTRDDNAGYSTFSQNADRLDAVASVFPVFFLLVAVLVCVTTMTRLIEEKRTEIGTLKALGYSNLSIIMKFVIYSMIAGVAGSIVGIAIGVLTIPFIIYNAYKIMYFIGDITLVLNIPSIVLGVLAAVVCTTVVSVVVCCRSLSHKPASIMRPKAPKAGKRIFLERITLLWQHLNFTSKLTARNLLRYKSRLCMTVIGVAGCTALIVAAFGLLNSFVPLTHAQFEDIYKYDAVVVPKESGSESDLQYLLDVVDGDDNVSDYMLAVQEEASVEFNGTLKEDGTYLEVVEKPEELGTIISLHTRSDKTELALSDNGVLINEKLSEEMGLEVGDTITVSSDSGKAEVKIEGIFEQYIYNYIYMSPTLYKSLYQKEVEYNMMDVVLKNTSDSVETAFSSHCLDNSKVAAVSYVASSLDDFRNMLNSLNMVVLVMITCAAALAFVVLYNLTNINIAERVREIATFKVLGFYNKETSAFIYIENVVLTILGIAVGLVLGIFLTGFIVQTVEVDNIMFGREIFFSSYLYAAGLTILFSLIVNFVMSFKIKAVNMVESLKSVE
jgi:putative ABC transport system permease protein